MLNLCNIQFQTPLSSGDILGGFWDPNLTAWCTVMPGGRSPGCSVGSSCSQRSGPKGRGADDDHNWLQSSPVMAILMYFYIGRIMMSTPWISRAFPSFSIFRENKNRHSAGSQLRQTRPMCNPGHLTRNRKRNCRNAKGPVCGLANSSSIQAGPC